MSNMQDEFKNLLTQLFTDESSAEQAATDYGQFAQDNGYDGIDYSQVDMSDAVYDVSNELNIPVEKQVAMLENAPMPTGPPHNAPADSPLRSVPAAASASSGPGGSSGAASGGGSSAAASSGGAVTAQASVEEYVAHNVTHYVTQVYEDNSVLNEFDQRVQLDIEGHVEGDIDFESVNTNATGDGAVAAGDDIEGAIATGDQALANDGANYGQQNTGDGAAQVGGDNSGVVNTGANEGVIANGEISDSNVATGGSTINDQDVSASGSGTAQGGVGNVNSNQQVDASGDALVGDGNQAVMGQDNQANFGSGDFSNVEDVSAHDSELNFGSGTQQANESSVTDDDTTTTTISSQDNDTTTQSSADTTTQTEHIDQSINDSFEEELDVHNDVTTEIDAEESVVELEEVEILD